MPDKNPEADYELFRLLSQRNPGPATPDTPPLPASPFAPDPPLLGGPPELAKLYHQLLSRAPNLKQLIPSVQFGPSEDYIDMMINNEKRGGDFFPADQFGKTNLLGITDTTTNKITLNPNLVREPDRMKGTLVHELAHVGPHNRGENTAYKAADLYYQSQGIEHPDVREEREMQELLNQLKDLQKDNIFTGQPARNISPAGSERKK